MVPMPLSLPTASETGPVCPVRVPMLLREPTPDSVTPPVDCKSRVVAMPARLTEPVTLMEPAVVTRLGAVPDAPMRKVCALICASVACVSERPPGPPRVTVLPSVLGASSTVVAVSFPLPAKLSASAMISISPLVLEVMPPTPLVDTPPGAAVCSETLPEADNAPATPMLPVLTMLKPPLLTVKLPIVVSGEATPGRSTSPITLPLLCSVATSIAPPV